MRIAFVLAFLSLILAAAPAHADGQGPTGPLPVFSTEGGNPHNGPGDSFVGDMCLPSNTQCFVCIGTAGPIAIYDNPDSGVGAGVGTDDIGLTVKVGPGSVDCPGEV
jgi:hypothetical protein